MKAHDLITSRWSPVAFDSKTPPQEAIDLLFEAARWAPSSYNAQPWKFIYGIRGDETYGKLFELLFEGNREWVRTAPLLILSMAEQVSPGRSSVNRFAGHDTGMAIGNMMLQATSMNLYMHPMGGYDSSKAVEVFDLPANWEPMAMLAAGYKGDPGQLPAEVAARESKPRTRNELQTFVFRTSPKLSH